MIVYLGRNNQGTHIIPIERPLECKLEPCFYSFFVAIFGRICWICSKHRGCFQRGVVTQRSKLALCGGRSSPWASWTWQFPHDSTSFIWGNFCSYEKSAEQVFIEATVLSSRRHIFHSFLVSITEQRSAQTEYLFANLEGVQRNGFQLILRIDLVFPPQFNKMKERVAESSSDSHTIIALKWPWNEGDESGLIVCTH